MPHIVPDLVSTIIPVYNRPQMLREALESVLAQTYRPIEIIISDDGSTDGTREVASTLAQADRQEIRFVRSESNRGPGPAREAGRQLARGEFIQYLDSDDLLRPRKFDVQVQALREHPECGAAYGYICLHPKNGPPGKEPYKWSGRTLPALFPWLLVDRWWNTDCPLFRRSVCDAVGPWNDLRWSQDWEYDARVGALGTRLWHCREFVCDQRQLAEVRQTTPADQIAPERLIPRKRLLDTLYKCALRAGVTHDTPEMRHFARWLFSTSRQCGAAGLARDAAECFQWAKEASGPVDGGGIHFRIYEQLSRMFGWVVTGRITCWLDRTFQKRPGRFTQKQSWMRS